MALTSRALDNDVNMLLGRWLGKVFGDITHRIQLFDTIGLVVFEDEFLNFVYVFCGNVDLPEGEVFGIDIVESAWILLLDTILEVIDSVCLRYFDRECHGLLVHETEEGGGGSHWC